MSAPDSLFRMVRLAALLSLAVVGACELDYELSEGCIMGPCGTPGPFPEPTASPVPAPAAPGVSFRSLSVGRTRVCGIAADGSGRCWGSGQLGNGSAAGSARPVRVASTESLAEIALGQWHTCARAQDGRLFCWGAWRGLTRTDFFDEVHVPIVVHPDRRFRSVSSGGGHSCGVLADQRVLCWGFGYQGQLGIGPVPFAASALVGTAPYAEVVAGGHFTCALTPAGEIHCWGENLNGQVGTATTDTCASDFPCSHAPVRVHGNLWFRALDAGERHSCGIALDGAAYCWGYNSGDGLLGTDWAGREPGSYLNYPVAVRGGLVFRQIDAGETHNCGVTTDGQGYCWGSNTYGALGDGSTERRDGPVAVTGGLRFQSIGVGQGFSCGLTVEGAAYCWGIDGFHLGRGS